MRKVLPIRIEFEYDESKDNEEIIQRIYNKIFEMAKKNVLDRQKLKREEVKVNNEQMLYIRSNSIPRSNGVWDINSQSGIST